MENYKSFSVTIRGEEHVKVNKVCQDASVHYSDDLVEIAIVADGHGSDDYFRSHVGSKIAVEVAFDVLMPLAHQLAGFNEEELENFRNDYTQQNALMVEVKGKIADLWRERIRIHHDENEFTEEDLESLSMRYVHRYLNERIFNWAYGTTLIATVVTKACWFAVQLGDGNCVEYYPQRGFVESMPKDPRCEGEVTTSLCQADALDSFRHILNFDIPQMVFVHTDGIDDTILPDEVRYDTYRAIGGSFIKDFECGVENIEKNILTHIAKNWKKDDTSLAGIVRMEGLTEEAQIIYRERIVKKKQYMYRQALSAEPKLEGKCRALEDTIRQYQDKQNAMETEYKALAERAKKLQEAGKKNKEAIQQYSLILEKTRKELEQNKSIIATHEAEKQTIVSEQLSETTEALVAEEAMQHGEETQKPNVVTAEVAEEQITPEDICTDVDPENTEPNELDSVVHSKNEAVSPKENIVFNQLEEDTVPPLEKKRSIAEELKEGFKGIMQNLGKNK